MPNVQAAIEFITRSGGLAGIGKLEDRSSQSHANLRIPQNGQQSGRTEFMLELAGIGEVAAMKLLPKRSVGNMTQYISMAPRLSGVFLPTNTAFVTGLWPVVLANAGATVLITSNALRLLMPYSGE